MAGSSLKDSHFFLFLLGRGLFCGATGPSVLDLGWSQSECIVAYVYPRAITGCMSDEKLLCHGKFKTDEKIVSDGKFETDRKLIAFSENSQTN